MRQFLVNSLFEIAVRARKSPWIETAAALKMCCRFTSGLVRARGLKRNKRYQGPIIITSGLVRARGLKRHRFEDVADRLSSGLVRARGLKLNNCSYL